MSCSNLRKKLKCPASGEREREKSSKRVLFHLCGFQTPIPHEVFQKAASKKIFLKFLILKTILKWTEDQTAVNFLCSFRFIVFWLILCVVFFGELWLKIPKFEDKTFQRGTSEGGTGGKGEVKPLIDLNPSLKMLSDFFLQKERFNFEILLLTLACLIKIVFF